MSLVLVEKIQTGTDPELEFNLYRYVCVECRKQSKWYRDEDKVIRLLRKHENTC